MKYLHRKYRIAKYVIYRQTLVNPKDHLWTFIGAFLGIGLIGFMHEFIGFFSINEKVFLIGSFGASAVLLYGATNSPLAQPRNLVGGHLVSAFIGVSVYKILNETDILWLNAALAVSLSIVVMQFTKTMHPPGGATALIANMGTPKVIGLGYFYILYPVLTGVSILLLIALITNNIPRNRAYPNKQLLRIRLNISLNESYKTIGAGSFRRLLQRNNKNKF